MVMPEGIPPIPEAERTPLVLALLQIIQEQAEQVQHLKDEIARLKGHKTKPDIKPSTLEAPPNTGQDPPQPPGKRPGSDKRPKKAQLTIHHRQRIPPQALPEGSRLKDVQTFLVQDLRLEPYNTCYELERWQTPDGRYLLGALPAHVRAGGHFGPGLKTLILFQHHAQQVTQPRIGALLANLGVDISTGQINRILQEGHEAFHAEKDHVLAAGLSVSAYIHVDDTAARHQGHNGYCTHIGNDYFAWFASTESKSRINFLQLLRGGAQDYLLNEDAWAWMQRQQLAQEMLQRLQQSALTTFADEPTWLGHLDALGIKDQRHRQIVTEGALLASALAHGLRRDLVIVSDDAGQFDVWLHALCWVHAERNLNKLIPFSDAQRADLETVRQELWQLYADLKAYKRNPDPTQKALLGARFDTLCQRQTCFASLKQALKRLHRNRAELLLVLQRPDIPLHNNLSEQDIRDYVTKRKISGGTRSPLGRRCRDTFMSLMKTCKKLGVSFWQFLSDRLTGTRVIPALPELLRQKAAAGQAALPSGTSTVAHEPNLPPGFVPT
jgi:transposase IS66 family protein